MRYNDDQDPGSPRRTAIRAPSRASKPPKTRKPRKHSFWLPRQADLNKTVEVLGQLSQDRSLAEIAADLRIEPNIVGYHRNNAVLLGLLDAKDRVTPEGHALLRLAPELRLGRLYYAFEASEVGRQWIARAQVKTLDELSPDSAGDFVRHLGYEENNTTGQAHEQALRLWCTKLKSEFEQLHLPAVARQPALDLLPTPVVFNRGGSRGVVRALAATSSRVSVATGYFNIDGYRQLADNFHYADLRLLIGSDDASRDQIKELLRRFRQDINRIARMSTADKREAVREFHLTTIRGNIRIRSLEAREKGSLHAKVYIFDREAAFVTSANLTGGAFFKNIEAGAVLRDPRAVGGGLDAVGELGGRVARVSLFRPEDSDTVEEAPAGHPHEHFLHRIAHGERLKPARSQSNLDADIDSLLALHFRDGPLDECQLVAALKILRSKDTPPPPRPIAPPKPGGAGLPSRVDSIVCVTISRASTK